jgi:hypothetical protein
MDKVQRNSNSEGNVCWSLVYMETCSVLSWSPRIHLHGNVFVNTFPSNGSTCHNIFIEIKSWIVVLWVKSTEYYPGWLQMFCANLLRKNLIWTFTWYCHGMACLRVSDGRHNLHTCMVANKLDKQTQSTDWGWFSSLGVGRWLTPHREKQQTTWNITLDLTICFSNTTLPNEVGLGTQW